jgi:hypothetical protein
MFDIELDGGESYRESANYQPGETAVISDLPWGRIGLTICYDVRFPALYRALAEAGASFIAVPSAFTVRTGEAHWSTLLRARAIENGCFIFAAAQAGKHESGRETWPFADRRSMGRNPCGRQQHRHRRRARENRSGEGAGGTQEYSIPAARPPLRPQGPERRPGPPASRARIGMIRYSLRCERGHAFELVSEFFGLRQPA